MPVFSLKNTRQIQVVSQIIINRQGFHDNAIWFNGYILNLVVDYNINH